MVVPDFEAIIEIELSAEGFIQAWPLLHRGMIMLPVPWDKNWCLHVHHWLVCLVLLPFCIPLYPTVAGAALILLAQGLAYKDRFTFLVRTPETYAGVI